VIEVAQQIVATNGRPADAVEIAERVGLDDGAVQPTLKVAPSKGAAPRRARWPRQSRFRGVAPTSRYAQRGG